MASIWILLLSSLLHRSPNRTKLTSKPDPVNKFNVEFVLKPTVKTRAHFIVLISTISSIIPMARVDSGKSSLSRIISSKDTIRANAELESDRQPLAMRYDKKNKADYCRDHANFTKNCRLAGQALKRNTPKERHEAYTICCETFFM